MQASSAYTTILTAMTKVIQECEQTDFISTRLETQIW